MTPEEVAAVLNYTAGVDERLERALSGDAYVAARLIATWTDALRDVPATVESVKWDVAEVVRRYYAQSGGDRSAQYHPVQPRDILAAWGRARTELLDRHVDPTPTADPDDVDAYLRELRAGRAAVATGRVSPSGLRQVTGTGVRSACSSRSDALCGRIRRDIALARAGVETGT